MTGETNDPVEDERDEIDVLININQVASETGCVH